MSDIHQFYTTILDNVSDGVYFVDRRHMITFWNKGAEKITGYKAAELSGKVCEADIVMHINEQGAKLCTGGCPLEKTLQDGIIREELVYLMHKAGHRVPVSARFIPIRDAGNTIIGVAEVFRDISAKLAEAAKMKNLAKMAYVDPLTELVNRQYVEYRLGLLLQDLGKGGPAFGVLLINIDQFKKLNTQHGTRIGDEILKMLAKTLSGSVAPADTVGRWLGAKYVIVSPNTNRSLLLLLANKVKSLAESSGLSVEESVLKVTVSVSGVIARPDDTADTLLERAERIMAYNLVRVQ